MGHTKARRLTVALLALVMAFAMIIPVSAATKSPGGGGDQPVVAPAATAAIAGSYVKTSDKTIKVYYTTKNAVKYKIAYRKAGASKWTYKTVTSKPYTINVPTNGLYEFTVAGINKDGKTGKYTTVKRRYVESTNVTLTGKSKAIRVKADRVSGARGYQIRYSTSKDMKNYKKVNVKTTKALDRTISGLTKGKTYYVQVRPYKYYNGHYYLGIAKSTKKVVVK